LLIVISGVALFAASTSTARAADGCIVKPTAEPPQGQHWYYRTDRESKRQCWYLGPEGTTVRKGAAESLEQANADAAATGALAQGVDNLSPQQREALFRRFIEWRRSRPAQ
jgi:hypothetical protein